MATIIDFLENATEESTDGLLRTLERAPHLLLQRKDSLLEALGQTWVGATLAEQRLDEDAGELWPVVPSGPSDAVSTAWARASSDGRIGTPHRAAATTRRESQTLLLYAHGIHRPNPLMSSENCQMTDTEYLRAIAEIATVAPLARSGVVRFHESSHVGEDMAKSLHGPIAELADRMALAIGSHEDSLIGRSVLTASADALLDRAFQRIQLINNSLSDPCTLLLPTEYDGPATMALLRLVGGVEGHQVRMPDGLLRLDQLSRLSLPGVTEITPDEMVDIRSDESFGVFRSDVAAALVDVAGHLDAGHLDAARRVVGEHMDAGLSRLRARTRRGVLADTVLGDAVGWGFGAALAASVDGLRGALAVLVGKTLTEFARSSPSPGERALRTHYVELGSSVQRPRDSVAIDFTSFRAEDIFRAEDFSAGRRAGRVQVVEELLDRLETPEN